MHRRHLSLTSSGYEVRREQLNGRDYVVVPVVALVEGAIHAMNADAHEFVPADTFKAATDQWNGRPLFQGHPLRDGKPISGNEPSVLASYSIGEAFNVTTTDNKLAMEAWVDEARCLERAPSMLERINAGDPIEVSVGVFVDLEDRIGTHGGTTYKKAWTNLMADHLALLPSEQIGACSRKMGCGVRAAAGFEVAIGNGNNQYTQDNATMSEGSRVRVDMPGHAAHGKLGTISQSAPSGKFHGVSVGGKHVGYFSEADLKHFEKGAGPKDKPSVKSTLRFKHRDKRFNEQGHKVDANGSLLSRMMAAMFRTAMPAEDMNVSQIKKKIVDVCQEKGVKCSYVEELYPELQYFVYTVYSNELGGKTQWFERDYTLADNGTVTIGDEETEVEPVMSYEPVGSEVRSATEIRAACKCKSHDAPVAPAPTPMETAMTPELKARVAALLGNPALAGKVDEKFFETASEAQVAAFEVLATPAPKVEVPAVVTPAPTVAAAAPVTLDTLLASASPEIRSAFEGLQRTAADKKTATIKVLKDSGRSKFTNDQLNAKGQDELDQLVALIGDVKPATDFSGQMPRAATDGKDAAPAPIDMGERIRAAQKK